MGALSAHSSTPALPAPVACCPVLLALGAPAARVIAWSASNRFAASGRGLRLETSSLVSARDALCLPDSPSHMAACTSHIAIFTLPRVARRVAPPATATVSCCWRTESRVAVWKMPKGRTQSGCALVALLLHFQWAFVALSARFQDL
ncbi:hypothetical protein MA16_Dca021788 [Dendrobium catenatum]|uniref:Uncharacterized protein n=1 Tax=Dendrobium catenatum TaxID=906689 RepID=A0A2I0WXW1_9ASPA|nr:hypothetical protein MA16_Dca021788 [Dendrobium catenatum]